MAKYRAYIQHSEDSVQAFTSMQFRLFGKKKRYTVLAAAVIALAAGALGVAGKTVSVILLMLGCLLFVDLKFIPRRTAKRLLSHTSVQDTVQYEFNDDGIMVWATNGTAETAYDRVVALGADSRFMFIFIGSNMAYSFSRDTLSPNDAEGFSRFMTQKTGLKWKRPSFIFNFSLPAKK